MIDLERFRNAKAIIADWDDTKVGTRPKVVEIVDAFADLLGAPRPGEEGLLEYWGRSVEDIIHGLFGSHKPHLSPQELLTQYYASVPENYCPNPITGVEKATYKLHEMGYVLGIVSSGPTSGILRDIDLHYPSLKSVYSFVHGKENTPVRKPAPEVFDPAFNDILYPLGITEKETIYVGDFHGDFDAAKARGLLFMGIVDNKRSEQWFLERNLDPQLIFPSFVHIPDFLEKIGAAKV